MSKNVKIQKKQDLNFFYLLSIIYKNLILFLILTIIPIFIAFITFYQSKDEYIYEIVFTQNYVEIEHQSVKCLISDKIPCRYDIYINKLLEDYKSYIDFKIFKNNLQLKGDNVGDLKLIEQFVRSSNEKISKNIYEKNVNKLKMIQNIINDPKYNFQKDDFFVGNIFYLNDLLNKFENGENIFTFSNTNLVKLPKFSNSFLILLLIFCPIFASGIIFVKENFKLIKDSN